MTYKTQFDENATKKQIAEAKRAGEDLLARFSPLFKKYMLLVRSGHIDYDDREMKRFICSFIGDPSLKAALKRRHATSKFWHQINKRFEFIVESYGQLPEDEMLIDMQMLFLILVKRYRQMGKNFCAYVYNSYGYEVSRHIKKFTRNPANIHYKNIAFEDYLQGYYTETEIENGFEDKIYENSQGVPDSSWIRGETCSDLFQCLTAEERMLIIKYYMEDYNDRQIAELYAMHINTVNQKRRKAVIKLANTLGVDVSKIKRNRKSGRDALLANHLS